MGVLPPGKACCPPCPGVSQCRRVARCRVISKWGRNIGAGLEKRVGLSVASRLVSRKNEEEEASLLDGPCSRSVCAAVRVARHERRQRC